jgi:hypothetical protein
VTGDTGLLKQLDARYLSVKKQILHKLIPLGQYHHAHLKLFGKSFIGILAWIKCWFTINQAIEFSGEKNKIPIAHIDAKHESLFIVNGLYYQ